MVRILRRKARPGQARKALKSLARPGKAFEARQAGKRETTIWVLEEGGVHPPLKDGSPRGPWMGGLRVGRITFGAPKPFPKFIQKSTKKSIDF